VPAVVGTPLGVNVVLDKERQPRETPELVALPARDVDRPSSFKQLVAIDQDTSVKVLEFVGTGKQRACIFLRSEVAACNRADGVARRHRLRRRGRLGSAAACSERPTGHNRHGGGHLGKVATRDVVVRAHETPPGDRNDPKRAHSLSVTRAA
jgi:hypothetical protein